MVKPKTPIVTQKHQIYFTCLLVKRKKNQIYYICVEEEPKKPKDKQICNDLSASVEAFFCCSCLLHMHIFTRERERERESYEKQKVRWENYMYKIVVETIVCMYEFQNVW